MACSKTKMKKSGGHAIALVENHWPLTWKFGFDPRPVHVGIVVESVALGLSISVFLCHCRSTGASDSFIHLLTKLYHISR